jgi:hypothetical protein
MESKRQWLLSQKPETLFTSIWLHKLDYSPKLINRYCQEGWLSALARGIYIHSGDKLSWSAALQALQTQLHIPFHLGGRSALKVQGIYHYARVFFDLMLCSTQPARLPSWFYPTVSETYPTTTVAYSWLTDPSRGLTDYTDDNGISVTASLPERAMLEVCALVGRRYGYDETAFLMESMPKIDITLMQALLESCTHIRAKRLLLHYAYECEHRWFDMLDLDRIHLGSGRRRLKGATRFCSKFQLHVPDTPLNEGWGRDHFVY